MSFQVALTEDAIQDLEELIAYIDAHDIPGKADYVLDALEKAFASLAENPQRGVCPKELAAIGLRDFREIYFKPYRTIYRTLEQSVYVMLVVDGRRDMQTMLRRRLLQANF